MNKTKRLEKRGENLQPTLKDVSQGIGLDSNTEPALKLRGYAKIAGMEKCWAEIEKIAKESRAKSNSAVATPVKPAAPALRAIVPLLKLPESTSPSPSAAPAEVRSAREVAGSPRSPFAATAQKDVTPSSSPRSYRNDAPSVRDSNSSSSLQSPLVARANSPREPQATPSPRTKTAAALLRKEGKICDRAFAVLEQKVKTEPLPALFTPACMPDAWFERFCAAGADTFAPAADFLSGGLKATAMDPVAIAGACAGAASVFFGSIDLKDGVITAGLPGPMVAMLGELVGEVQYRHLHENSSADDISVVLANLIATALAAKVNVAYRAQARGFLLAAMGQPGQSVGHVLDKTALTLRDRGTQVLGAICNAARNQGTNVRLRDYSVLDGREQKFKTVFADVCRPSKDGMDGNGNSSSQGPSDLPAALLREMASGTTQIVFADGEINKLMQHENDFNVCTSDPQKKMLAHLCNQRLMVRMAAEINEIGCIKDASGQVLVASTLPRCTYTIKPASDGSFSLSCRALAYVDKAKVFGTMDARPLAMVGSFELLTTVVIDVKGIATLKEARLKTRNINQLVEWESVQGNQVMARSAGNNTTPVKL